MPISMIRHGLCHPCFRRSAAASPRGGTAANSFERADHPVVCGHTPQGMGSSRNGTAPASMAVRRPTIGCPGLSARAPSARRLELLGTVQRSHADPPSVYRYITGSSTRSLYRPPRGTLRQGRERHFSCGVSATHPVASCMSDRPSGLPGPSAGHRTPLPAVPLAHPSLARARDAAKRTVDQDRRRSALSTGSSNRFRSNGRVPPSER